MKFCTNTVQNIDPITFTQSIFSQVNASWGMSRDAFRLGSDRGIKTKINMQ